MRLLFFLSFLATAVFHSKSIAQSTVVPDGFEFVYAQDFESPQAINNFEMTDASAWRITGGESNNTMELFGESDYEASVRSPFNIALIKDIVVGDFILEVSLSQTGREYGHRDLCLFFGVNSPTNFYYVHMASVADNNANNIFLVNDEPRTNIATKTTTGIDWGETDSWHKVRIERDVAAGSIKVYFDDMSTPIMVANDTHFAEGRIGIGSFDDTGQFDNIRIWSPKLFKPKMGFYR